MNQTTILARDIVLETSRLLLRIVSEGDIPAVFAASQVPGFTDGMLWEPPATTAELRENLLKSLAAWDTGQAFAFSIYQTGDSALVGRIGIRKTETNDVWNLGFWTHPDHQGRGFMTEAAHRIIELGFTELNAHQIEAFYAAWNQASRRVLEKLGMKFMEHRPRGFLKRGKWVPDNRMVISRQEWLER